MELGSGWPARGARVARTRTGGLAVPRKWLETVRPWPALDSCASYPLRVTRVEKCADPPALRVELEFTLAEQAGRRHSVLLPLPIRPAGLTCDFLRACGLDAAPGKTVAPRDALGKAVLARFAPSQDAGPWQVVGFSAAPEEAPNR
jgi:hypothetical protein